VPVRPAAPPPSFWSSPNLLVFTHSLDHCFLRDLTRLCRCQSDMAPGAAVEFKRKIDRNGKTAAWDVTVAGASASTMPCFSMSQPFASLLLNGIKTIETRNSDIFGPFAGLRTVIIRLYMACGHARLACTLLSRDYRPSADACHLGCLQVSESFCTWAGKTILDHNRHPAPPPNPMPKPAIPIRNDLQCPVNPAKHSRLYYVSYLDTYRDIPFLGTERLVLLWLVSYPRFVDECFATANPVRATLRRRPWKDDHYLERLRARQVFRNDSDTHSRLRTRRAVQVQHGLRPPLRKWCRSGREEINVCGWWKADGSADERWIREPTVHFCCIGAGALGSSLRQPERGGRNRRGRPLPCE
jgi:hypothetical protein